MSRLNLNKQSGQVMAEYVIVTAVLIAALFTKLPGSDLTIAEELMLTLKLLWSNYFYAISYPI